MFSTCAQERGRKLVCLYGVPVSEGFFHQFFKPLQEGESICSMAEVIISKSLTFQNVKPTLLET